LFQYQDVTLKNIGAIGNSGKYNTIGIRTQVTF
jgi:hypothetical protein